MDKLNNKYYNSFYNNFFIYMRHNNYSNIFTKNNKIFKTFISTECIYMSIKDTIIFGNITLSISLVHIFNKLREL